MCLLVKKICKNILCMFPLEQKFGLSQVNYHARFKLIPHIFVCHGLLFHPVGHIRLRDFLFGKVSKFEKKPKKGNVQ